MAHRARFGGSWRTTKQPSIRHAGTWRQASAAWIRQGGAWRKWWPDLPDRGGPYLYGSIASAGPNVIRHNGSLWVAVGGGRPASVRHAAVNDAGDLFVGGNLCADTNGALHLWDGASWSRVGPTYVSLPNTLIASDGDRFFTMDGQGGIYGAIADIDGVTRATIDYEGGGGSTISLLGFSASGLVSPLAYAFYGNGDWRHPRVPPAYLDGTSGLSTTLAGLGTARQLDGCVWCGGSTVVKETAVNVGVQVGAGSFVGGYYPVRTVCALPDGRAWAGGDFTTYNGSACVALAEWNGADWVQIGSGLTYVQALAFHQGKLWILHGSSLTARKVYTWDGTTLAQHSDWTGDSIYGLV